MTTHSLQAAWITSAAFRPFGQLICASEDGAPYGKDDAQLRLQNGIPRFYIMRLQHRGCTFDRITRHQRCTQCLGALQGKDWLLAVAPPSAEAQPDLGAIAAFRIPGDCFIKLNIGTWHAGPYFTTDVIDFYNLELSDTNLTDHETFNLKAAYGNDFEIVF
ncbi:ureidoglycolate lyase [Myxacorys almedinensis]|uniref:Ureidoglycolate hydrolase n=1 Tax=Myxacorys almedinensis A TaxID=2690445 RepID=A0A8J8CGU5_9CYAN|nr:ureidoglycolate lyase [Myxacorys almedinensis]NDJ16098.1 Ureidoglycolate hydrolase [Myxacorys almedinensis A]